MTDRVFIDSNVWLYLFLQSDARKSDIAQNFISGNIGNHIFVTYQVINEVSNQLLKNGFGEKTVRDTVMFMHKICVVRNFSRDMVILASAIRENYKISFWDSMIVAAALICDCNILASEDMQDGLKIENTTIKNVFKAMRR